MNLHIFIMFSRLRDIVIFYKLFVSIKSVGFASTDHLVERLGILFHFLLLFMFQHLKNY